MQSNSTIRQFNNSTTRTAIITGIGGQDGAYLAKYLISLGYRVTGITRSLTTFQDFRLKYLGILDQVRLIECREMDRASLVGILEEVRPEEVYNLAAQSSVGLSFEQPYATVQFNILSVLSWLEAILETNKAVKFYQASSSEMFGNIDRNKLPLRENLMFHPASPYGISKAAAHWLVVNYREARKMFAANGILFNHESALRGMNYVVKKIINHLVKIKLQWTDQPLTVGNTAIRRDWGYAPYYVAAMHRILQHHSADDFLVCSGNVMSLDDLIDKACNRLGLDKERYVKTDPALYRPNELFEIYGDPSKARLELGWKYELSNDELIAKLIEDEIDFIHWESAHRKA
ncbi:MAG TPA: GDP-mannose 4,6-dehydratase [Saprospiraceae bacterium]|nr:GDP-mannose 4,6-dehydratase [Saprospiraceae bacterium]HNT19432.1 GDP-mannose 4,6-dehydratase [Saprospiraceae bacterium]